MRDSFLFYRSFYEAISDLEAEDRIKVYDAICEYALNGNEPELRGAASAIFKMAKPQINANNKRYENGKKGGRPSKKETKTEPTNNQNKTKAKPSHNLDETKTKPNVNVNDNVNDNEKESPKGDKKKRFIKPTVDEVRAYCFEKCINVDAEYFVDYYDSNGWMVGKSAMKDWKACVRRWGKNTEQNKTKSKSASQNRFNNLEQRQYDFPVLEQALLNAQRARDG